jgi:hypothetical protein
LCIWSFKNSQNAIAYRTATSTSEEKNMIGLASVRGYLAAGLLVALLISGAVNYWQHRENRALERARAELVVQVRAALEANESQSAALASLETANGELVAACTSSAEARTQAAEAERFRSRIAAASTRIANEGSNDYVAPKCADVLALDLAGACPAIVRGLLERAGPRASADGRGARSGSSVAAE